nr:PREDICTED: proton-coupled amino acid transporter-like protein CG1139 isoform X1 [Bemisia tabaci]
MELSWSRDKMGYSQAATDEDSNKKNPENGEDYEPYDHEPPGKTASYFEALLILIKASVGTGVLGMPRAFYNAGYILGFMGTVFAGILSTVTVHLISASEHELCRRKRIPQMSYPETVEAAFEHGPGNSKRFKKTARIICQLALVMLEFGADCAYAIFIADNIKEICDHIFSPAPVRFYLLCLLGPLILMCWIRNLKFLAPGSTLGTGCAIGCVGFVFYFVFSQPITLEGRKAAGSLTDFSLFFGQVLFAFGAYGMVVSLKNRMRRPASFGSPLGVLNVAMVPNVVLYVVMGLFGYLAYGTQTKSSITLNLSQTGFIGDLIRILMAGSIFTTYPLCNYIVIEQLWHKNLALKFKDSNRLVFWEYVFRTAVTCANIACCIAVPNLELIMALSGSLMVPTLGVWLPSITHTLTFWNKYKGIKFAFFLSRTVILMLVGLFASVVSLSTTVREIYGTAF